MIRNSWLSAVDASPAWVTSESGGVFSCPFSKVEVIKKAYMQGEVEFEDGENGEDGAASPRNVGHNIYILAHQVQPSLSGPPRPTSVLSCPDTDSSWKASSQHWLSL